MAAERDGEIVWAEFFGQLVDIQGAKAARFRSVYDDPIDPRMGAEGFGG